MEAVKYGFNPSLSWILNQAGNEIVIISLTVGIFCIVMIIKFIWRQK